MSCCSLRAWVIQPSTSGAASRESVRTSFCGHSVSSTRRRIEAAVVLLCPLLPWRRPQGAWGERLRALLQMQHAHLGERLCAGQTGGLRYPAGHRTLGQTLMLRVAGHVETRLSVAVYLRSCYVTMGVTCGRGLCTPHLQSSPATPKHKLARASTPHHRRPCDNRTWPCMLESTGRFNLELALRCTFLHNLPIFSGRLCALLASPYRNASSRTLAWEKPLHEPWIQANTTIVVLTWPRIKKHLLAASARGRAHRRKSPSRLAISFPPGALFTLPSTSL